jgi:formylglycine-generating enzyme required for sulfatase activity
MVLAMLGALSRPASPAPAVSSSGSGGKPDKSGCPLGAVLIPAGTFPIGTTVFQAYDDDEQPRRMVTLSHAYCIDRTEVTVRDYAACAAAGRCKASKPAFAGDDLPMTNVSWKDARDACGYRGGRLPSEVEWEHAARGSDDRLYPWGSWQPDCRWADLWGEMWGSCGGYGPSPVGAAKDGASPFGVLDMAGNVLEWVDDAYDADAWRWVDAVDPRVQDDLAPRHGVRGGCWDYDVVHSLRVSDRDGYPSALRDATLGFRCAYDP